MNSERPVQVRQLQKYFFNLRRKEIKYLKQNNNNLFIPLT
jgi:hypothetical protein